MKIGKKVKLIGKIAFYTIFVVLSLLVVGMFFSKISNRIFFVGGKSTIWVMTDSMEDTIPAQSYILVRKAQASDVRVGDVITFYSDDPALRGNMNTHRVVEIKDGGNSFVTKGDNALANDPYPARGEAIVGIYERNLEVFSVAGRFIQSPAGLILIVLLIIYSFVWEPLKKLLQKEKSDPDKQE